MQVFTAIARFFLAPVHGNKLVYPNPKRRMYRHLLQVPLGRPKDLLSREYLRSTLQIWVLWFGVAFTYYGMVLASAEVLRLRNAESKSIHSLIRYLLTIIMQPVEMSQSFHFLKNYKLKHLRLMMIMAIHFYDHSLFLFSML